VKVTSQIISEAKDTTKRMIFLLRTQQLKLPEASWFDSLALIP
jgi:hypothetical protein